MFAYELDQLETQQRRLTALDVEPEDTERQPTLTGPILYGGLGYLKIKKTNEKRERKNGTSGKKSR